MKPWEDMSPKTVTEKECAATCMTVLCFYHLHYILKYEASHAVTEVYFLKNENVISVIEAKASKSLLMQAVF